MSKITIIAFGILTICAIQGFGQRFNQQTNPIQPRAPLPPNDPACPESNARYPMPGQCDAYIECKDGQPEEKLCPDGLLFNDKVSVFTFPCRYPIDVDCVNRGKTQPPQATEDCPHQFGYFKVGDEVHCGQFMNCVDGRGYTFDCPEGLAFNKESYRCDWADEVPDCDAERYLGFACPTIPEGLGVGELRSYRAPDDCQRYFICVNGKPRLYNCGEGNAFNDLTNTCDGIENVTSCLNGPFRDTNTFRGAPTKLVNNQPPPPRSQQQQGQRPRF